MNEPVSCFVPAVGTGTIGVNEMDNPLNHKHNPRHIHKPDISSNLVPSSNHEQSADIRPYQEFGTRCTRHIHKFCSVHRKFPDQLTYGKCRSRMFVHLNCAMAVSE
jgi:hypothetical protein